MCIHACRFTYVYVLRVGVSTDVCVHTCVYVLCLRVGMHVCPHTSVTVVWVSRVHVCECLRTCMSPYVCIRRK